MHRVGFVTFAGFGAMGLAGLSAFETANLTNGERVYEITLLSETGGLVRCSTGFSVMTEPFGDTVFDTLIVGAMPPCFDEPMPNVVAFIRQSLKTARRIAGPCTGAFLLAAAGALNGRRATTHWLFARELAARYPELTLDADRIFIVDGPIWTSAGVTACIDLALAMVEKDLGAEIARPQNGGLPSPRRRSVAVFDPARIGAQVRSHSKGSGLCRPKLEEIALCGGVGHGSGLK